MGSWYLCWDGYFLRHLQYSPYATTYTLSGTFSQYDTMIYPPTESVLKQLKGILSKQETEKHPEIHCPPPDQMRELCLIYYLKVHEPVFKLECMPDSTSKLVSDVMVIYLQLADHLIYTDSKVSPPSYEEWPVENLKKVRINHNPCFVKFSIHSIPREVST